METEMCKQRFLRETTGTNCYCIPRSIQIISNIVVFTIIVLWCLPAQANIILPISGMLTILAAGFFAVVAVELVFLLLMLKLSFLKALGVASGLNLFSTIIGWILLQWLPATLRRLPTTFQDWVLILSMFIGTVIIEFIALRLVILKKPDRVLIVSFTMNATSYLVFGGILYALVPLLLR